ncbi:hypothetical protein Desti_4942 [Desulfomonile tiedjei DSM 6799]|uniref:Uncharacterized protein n=1 Tax=Desulfomonile tiedjei (strain ATCC 49306 / DSM 6799 / DCB-1) TaxID=706587 RepID=I4CDB5_DESTA|nr:hypothetical protein Desti_4942 [Desulfomonile tiedjei DSM 6799]
MPLTISPYHTSRTATGSPLKLNILKYHKNCDDLFRLLLHCCLEEISERLNPDALNGMTFRIQVGMDLAITLIRHA